MKPGTLKRLRVGCILLAIFSLFCTFTLLPQPVRAQAVTARITDLNEPFDVAVAPNGEYAYVTDGGSGSISVINTATNRVMATLAAGVGPFDVAIAPNGSYAYVTDGGSGSVSVVDTATNKVTASITVGNGPFGVAMAPNGDYAYVANFGSGTVSVINTATNKVISTIPVSGTPQSVAVTSNGEYAYVTNFGMAKVSVINTTTNTVTATISVETGPFGLAVTPNGNYVYVANSGSGSVSVINTATNRVAATITGLKEPLGIAITPNGAYAYVANDGNGTVSVINTATNTVMSTITVGSGPYDVAFSPNNEYAFVTNSNSGTVSVINVPPAVKVSPSICTMGADQFETLSATSSGGSGSYKSYQWYVDGFAQSVATASKFIFAPTSNGSYSITAAVTDSLGTVSAPSSPATITVGSATAAPTPTQTSTPTPPITKNGNVTWEIPSNIALPAFAAIILIGIYLILKLSKNKTNKISSLRLFTQINAVIAIFMGLILGPFDTPTWQPMGPSPRSLLLGAKFLGNKFPDGFSVPVLACYYSNGRTATCALWQLQAYIFPYWNYSNGYNAIYSTSGLEKIGIVVALVAVASVILGRFFCGWLCPFGLYQDVLTRIRKTSRLRHLHLSEKTNRAVAQSRYVIIAVILILCVIFASYSIFGAQLIPGTTPAGPTGQAGNVGNLEQPFCLVCPMRPLCILLECAVGEMKFSYISKITYGPLGVTGFYLTSINLSVLIAITILALAYRRFWCRICPLGGLTALFSTFTPFKQIALTRLSKNEQKCTKCGVCKRVCPTQATAVYERKGGDVTESRCILCARCLEVCPYEDALALKVAGKTVMKSRDWLKQQ